MLAPHQYKCLECGEQFVPFSKNLVRAWGKEFHAEIHWLDSPNWTIDRVYQQGLRYCSPECADLGRLRAAIDGIEREQRKILGKRR